MNSNIPSSQNDIKTQLNKNSLKSQTNYDSDQNELKNLRMEFSLSLRKKKINEILFSKRLEQMTKKNTLEEGESNDLYASLSEIKRNVPSLLFDEFDIYEDKISVIHQILNKDYTMLHGMQFNEKYILQFVIYKLTELSYENKDFFFDTNEKDLIMIFYDIIN